MPSIKKNYGIFFKAVLASQVDLSFFNIKSVRQPELQLY